LSGYRCKHNDIRPSCRGEVLGLGTDLCAVARMARALDGPGQDILGSLFTPAEIARYGTGANPAGELAACFAAKEAVVKALAAAGGRGCFWQDIEVAADGGRPVVALSGRLGELASTLGVRRILLAQGRCRRYATATALATT
jgi:holo-[acyl-carrier protein] synthase